MSRLADASPFEVTVEDGCTLRGWRHGTASERPPILFVHGLGSSSIDWDESVDYFALAGRQVLTIDLRGHGQSDKGPRPLPVERHAADLLAALDHLGLDSLELVGLSLGGQIALELVACAPRRFRNLAVACCALDTRRHRPRVLAQWITRSIVLHGLGLSSSTRVLAKKLFPKP
ncbi:MAG: alpha/beta fold hydrolase [Planctomycetota bacterium]